MRTPPGIPYGLAAFLTFTMFRTCSTLCICRENKLSAESGRGKSRLSGPLLKWEKKKWFISFPSVVPATPVVGDVPLHTCWFPSSEVSLNPPLVCCLCCFNVFKCHAALSPDLYAASRSLSSMASCLETNKCLVVKFSTQHLM